MTEKSLRCNLKPHVSYKKIPKTCLKICNNIAHRRQRHKRHKTVAFNTNPPVNPNVLPVKPEIDEVTPVEEPTSNANETNEETPPIVNATETAEKHPPKQTGIINSITNTASNLFGLSTQPVSNNNNDNNNNNNNNNNNTNNVKVGGKTAKKRKCNNKKTKKNKRKNKLKR